ncbi:MAG: sigma-70 family RNA polymerase sigma factor [Thermodesulfobacteriota bacterium]
MNAQRDEDFETIRRVLGGDYNGFEILVEKYQGRIYRHLRKMVKDDVQAEDLLQETFLNAFKGLGGFTGDSAFSTWLFRIATNNALMFLRKTKADSVEYDDEIKMPDSHDMPVVSPVFVSTPLEVLLSHEGQRKIEQAIDGLPVIYRSVVMLRDVEGFSLQEVAGIMDTTVAAVKSRLHRGRNWVRQQLSEYYGDSDAARPRRTVTAK